MISVNTIIFLILNDWKCDKCRWHHHGRKSIKGIIKDYYVSVSGAGTNPSFKRYAYHILEDACNRALIHYVGNHEIATASCHGNNKVMRTLTCTCPSVLRTAEKTDIMPSVYYEGELSYSDYSPQYLLKLRNTKQIANLQHSHRQKFRFSHDGLYNVHELSYDLGSFLVPSFFLIHERKLQSSHEELMKIVADEVPPLVKGKTTCDRRRIGNM